MRGGHSSSGGSEDSGGGELSVGSGLDVGLGLRGFVVGPAVVVGREVSVELVDRSVRVELGRDEAVVDVLLVGRDARVPDVVAASRPMCTVDGVVVVTAGMAGGWVAPACSDISVTVPAKSPPSSMPASATATGT